MHDAVFRAWAGWLVGGVLLGLGSTILGFAGWWTFARERFSPWALALRALLGLLASAALLGGMVVAGIGTEAFLGNPLGRWTGSSMVLALWLTLEIYARDAALTAALASRDLDSDLAWFYARLVWLASWGALASAGLVAVLATLGA